MDVKKVNFIIEVFQKDMGSIIFVIKSTVVIKGRIVGAKIFLGGFCFGIIIISARSNLKTRTKARVVLKRRRKVRKLVS